VVTVCGAQELGADLGASVTEAALAIALDNGPVVLRRADVPAADALARTLERGAEFPCPVAARLLEPSAPSREGERSAVTVCDAEGDADDSDTPASAPLLRRCNLLLSC
jgi:hypothetical protein